MVICLEIGSRQRAPLRCLRLAWYGILGDGAESWMGGGNRMQQWLDMNIWQIMKDWNETGRRKTIVAMNFQAIFLLEPANDLKNWCTNFFRRWIPILPKGKLPLARQRAFTSLDWQDATFNYDAPIWQNHTPGTFGTGATYQNTITEAKEDDAMAGCLGFCCFFSFFHGLILNT